MVEKEKSAVPVCEKDVHVPRDPNLILSSLKTVVHRSLRPADYWLLCVDCLRLTKQKYI